MSIDYYFEFTNGNDSNKHFSADELGNNYFILFFYFKINLN